MIAASADGGRTTAVAAELDPGEADGEAGREVADAGVADGLGCRPDVLPDGAGDALELVRAADDVPGRPDDDVAEVAVGEADADPDTPVNPDTPVDPDPPAAAVDPEVDGPDVEPAAGEPETGDASATAGTETPATVRAPVSSRAGSGRNDIFDVSGQRVVGEVRSQCAAGRDALDEP